MGINCEKLIILLKKNNIKKMPKTKMESILKSIVMPEINPIINTLLISNIWLSFEKVKIQIIKIDNDERYKDVPRP